MSFPGGSDGQKSACSAGDLSLIFRLGRSLGEGNGYPLQYSCLENSMDRGSWQATASGFPGSLVGKEFSGIAGPQFNVWWEDTLEKG